MKGDTLNDKWRRRWIARDREEQAEALAQSGDYRQILGGMK